MRELLAARSGRDAVLAGPAPRGRARSAPSFWALIGASLAARPAAVVGTLLVAGAGLAIGVNALAFQTHRHPAPLFSERQAAAPAPVRRAEAAPRPVEAPARVEPAAAPAPVAAPLPPARPAPAPAAAAQKPAGRDQIGDLLRTGEATGAGGRAAPAADPQRKVAAAQRALVRLGYGPLSTDGVMGAATRGAIERFERDRRIAATGELGPRTVRELAAAAGHAIE